LLGRRADTSVIDNVIHCSINALILILCVAAMFW
jgi:hypothetical protein